MVKLTAVHYGFDDDIFPKNLKPKTIAFEKPSTAEKKEPNVDKTKIDSVPKSTGGRVRKSLRKKKKSLKTKQEQMSSGKMKATKPRPIEFTCDNCGEIFKTVQTYNLHKSQDFC